MKQPAYLKLFPTKNAAAEHCRNKNRANRMARWLWVLADGPEDNFAVLDLASAIELGGGYEWTA